MDSAEKSSIQGTPTSAEPLTPICSGDGGIIAVSPLCDHYNDQMRIDSLTTCSDEEIIESLYQNLFSIVLSLQIEESGSGSHTPLSAPCPGAPMKLTKLSRNIDPGFQRKLF
ncbi:cyclin-dependent protein kinase inhibitor SMR16 [Capsella rubella]|nr:cyclin-dependent protein kinase inhibitor SMR16 [Capsella rubella]